MDVIVVKNSDLRRPIKGKNGNDYVLINDETGKQLDSLHHVIFSPSQYVKGKSLIPMIHITQEGMLQYEALNTFIDIEPVMLEKFGNKRGKMMFQFIITSKSMSIVELAHTFLLTRKESSTLMVNLVRIRAYYKKYSTWLPTISFKQWVESRS